MLPNKIFQLRPSGWEADLAEERYKLSTIDPAPNCAYNYYVLFFHLDSDERAKAADVLKAGLGRTLSQARYLCGRIEKDPSGGYSFVKTKTSTVKFVVKSHAHPSLRSLEEAHFACKAMGDLSLWSANTWMTSGEGKPEADPDQGAVVAAYQANFVPGGLVLSRHSHHYASDVMGWSNFTRQLTENCHTVYNGTSFPAWNPACIDTSRFTRYVPESARVDGPPAACDSTTPWPPRAAGSPLPLT